MIDVRTGGELTMEGVSFETNASAVFVAPENTKVTIKNSTFAVKAYAVTTNASTSMMEQSCWRTPHLQVIARFC